MGHDIEVKGSDLELTAHIVPQTRYNFHYEYDDVCLDLVETVIIDGQVNAMMMAFLLQGRNQGEKDHLITKH